MATTQTGSSGSTSGTRSATSSGMQAGMGERTPDTTYNLISVMYHALHGCETYQQYAEDAEQAGQQDVAQFFRETGQEFERCTERGQRLLAQCLQQEHGSSGRSSQMSQNAGAQGQQASRNNLGGSSANLSGTGTGSGSKGSTR